MTNLQAIFTLAYVGTVLVGGRKDFVEDGVLELAEEDV